ncbi:hypothetical protein CVT24_004783 [Panaeolus cyanescens]|uniref:Uncharacterized protein n=1 Tax=Panaeolus cyanescens TaxID=181874 RepID=A0A409V9V0_9AGAR|nr:hypothetical protein CVT24_004783 [Panaeolus cyanescens]
MPSSSSQPLANERIDAHRPRARILLCFIDYRPPNSGQPTAHYTMVALPSTYEAAAATAYKAFQHKMGPNNIRSQGDLDLMIKGFVKFGDSSANVSQPSNVWADIYPQEDWKDIVRDGDEVLVCPKVPLMPYIPTPIAARPESIASASRTSTSPSTSAGPKKTIGGPTVTLYCKPYGSTALPLSFKVIATSTKDNLGNMDRQNSTTLDGTGEESPGLNAGPYLKSPFLDVTGTTSSPVSEVPPTLNFETRNQNTQSTASPPARILFCFIDRKGGGQNAHYALVPLPPSYETAMDLAFEAFQAQFLDSNVLANFEIVLMIKCAIRLGDPTGAGSHSTTIWANIHPIDQWSSLVRDGDEILVCPKLPAHRPQRTVSFAQDATRGPASSSEPSGEPPLSEGTSKITLCHKPHKSDTYKNETVGFVQSFEALKQLAHDTFGSSRKSSKLKIWNTEHITLYLNTTPAAMAGTLPRPNGHTVRKPLDSTSWPTLVYQVAKDPNFYWEVEVVYDSKK